MTRLLLALMVIAAPAQAFDWPWQNRQDADYSFCKGFVYAGLASLPVENLSRIQLWLTWDEAISDQFERGALDQARYDAGRARFSDLLGADDISGLMQVAASECAIAEG